MKIEKEFREDHQVKLIVEVDPEPFETSKRKAARKVASRIKIPGFRPGKAPYGVILKQVGEGYIVEQALELLIDEQYPEIIKEADITPFGSGTLEKVSEIDPPTFELVVPLDPVVELGDYKSIKIPYEPPVIGDEEVNQAIEQARERQATREKVDRPAEMGDIVYMRISGSYADGEESEGEVIIEERFSSSVIQEAKENEFPYPGFSLALLGLSAEEEKLIPHQYPDDHEDQNLKGRKAEFKVTVTNVQSLKMPDINDDLALEASEFDTLEEWKSDLKATLEEDAKQDYVEKYDDQVIDLVVAESKIKYPPQMIENEKENILRSLELRLSQQGLTRELYLQIRGLDEDGLNQEITPVAEERIKRSLVLFEIAKAEEIKIDENQVKDETGRTIDAISRSMTPNEAKKFAQSGYIPGLITNIAADLTTQTTMEFLRATAKGEPWPSEVDQVEEVALESDLEEITENEGEIQINETEDKNNDEIASLTEDESLDEITEEDTNIDQNKETKRSKTTTKTDTESSD